MNFLFVVAHPDDEVLGAGGTIYRLAQEGHRTAVAVMSSRAGARKHLSISLEEDQKLALSILGVETFYNADFPNIKMNTVPHLELVQFIEDCIERFQAEVVFTHHPSDTNIDHQETSRAAQAASRLFQRRSDVPQLREFVYMEVPSSTEWSFNSSAVRFSPNYFIQIGETGLTKKLEALRAYSGVMRPYPHPRSDEALRGLAAYRGVQAGCGYAEAFECVFRAII